MKYLFFLILIFFYACNDMEKKEPLPNSSSSKLTISEMNYGEIQNQSISLFQLKNENSMTVNITNYGGIITQILVPDKNGNMEDVVLGYDSLAHYVEKTPYFGAFLGRYANRIAKGKFSLNGKSYQLAINNGVNALHGGVQGFDKKIWKATSFENTKSVGVLLSGVSPDGEEGYPGNLKVTVKYELNNQNELHINYAAETDQTTVVNFTNHTYFNLKGADQGSITDHIITINADSFTPVDATSIPTGEIRSVKNTPFDFLQPTRIGDRINDTNNPQIKIGNGYDHNFILNRKEEKLSLAASVYEPSTGRVLEVLTTEPAVQFYTGNYLGKKFIGKKGKTYASRDGFCLETQHYPDAPNQPDFPSTVLKPEEKFESSTVFKFYVKE